MSQRLRCPYVRNEPPLGVCYYGYSYYKIVAECGRAGQGRAGPGTLLLQQQGRGEIIEEGGGGHMISSSEQPQSQSSWQNLLLCCEWPCSTKHLVQLIDSQQQKGWAALLSPSPPFPNAMMEDGAFQTDEPKGGGKKKRKRKKETMLVNYQFNTYTGVDQH